MDRDHRDNAPQKRAATPTRSARSAKYYQKPKRRRPADHSASQPNFSVQGYTPASVKRVSQRKPQPRRKTVYLAVMAVLAAVFVFAAYQVVHYFVKSHQAKQDEQLIQAMIAQSELAAEETVAPEPEATPTAQPEPTPAAALQQVVANIPQPTIALPQVLPKFSQALEINPDTVGQLQMGESINTYVVQRDNEYYLRRSFSGEYSFSGTVFMDVSCSIFPQSRMLIIHGHNMRDGTAFGKLSRFESIDYLNKYPFIKFSTLYEAARYVPFAVVYYSIDAKSELYLDVYQVNGMTDADFMQFVSKVQTMSEYRLPVNVSRSGNILMVTTCATGDSDMRFAVFAVKSDTI